jgi:hypothetical protein
VKDCEPGVRHYQVLSGEVKFGGGYMEPPEWGQCWNWYLAKNKDDARQQAVKDSAFKEWVRDMRGDGKPPWTGLEVTLCRCEHGICWACKTAAVSNCSACECGYTDAEMCEELKMMRDDLHRAA